MLFDELFDPSASEETPIACDPSAHTENELKDHDQKVEGLLADREEMRKVSGGYAFRFPARWDWVERIFDVVRYERKCCPFLTFGIAFEPEERGIWLYIGGNEEVEEYLVEAAEELDA
ncbi:MAG: hypothetical protein ABEK84_09725 [Salinibacter sp.]